MPVKTLIIPLNCLNEPKLLILMDTGLAVPIVILFNPESEPWMLPPPNCWLMVLTDMKNQAAD